MVVAGAEYEVNISLDTSKVETQLKNLEKRINTFRAKINGSVSAQERKARLEDRIAATMVINRRLSEQILRLEEKGVKMKEGRAALDKAMQAVDKNRIETARAHNRHAKEFIQNAEKELAVQKKQATIEKANNSQFRKNLTGIVQLRRLKNNFLNELNVLEAKGVKTAAMRKNIGKFTDAQNDRQFTAAKLIGEEIKNQIRNARTKLQVQKLETAELEKQAKLRSGFLAGAPMRFPSGGTVRSPGAVGPFLPPRPGPFMAINARGSAMRFPSGDPVRNAAAVGPFLPPVAGQSSPIGLGYSGPMRFPSGDPVRSSGVVGPFLPPLSGESNPIGGRFDIPGSPLASTINARMYPSVGAVGPALPTSGPSNPIRGGFLFPGSPGFFEGAQVSKTPFGPAPGTFFGQSFTAPSIPTGTPGAARVAERQAAATALTQQTFNKRLGDVALGAGFPLLFGGGPGAVLGGAAGALTGGGLAAQIGFSALGQQFDQLATAAGELGVALDPLRGDFEAVTAAAGEVNTEFGDLIAALAEQLSAQEALEAASNRLATTIGVENVTSLQEFGGDLQDLGNEFSKLASMMLGSIAALINQAGILKAITGGLERGRLMEKGRTSSDPEIQRLRKQRSQAFIEGDNERAAQLADQIISIVRANEQLELQRQTEEATQKLTDKRLRGLKAESVELKAQRTILQGKGDLLNKDVFAAQELLAEMRLMKDVDKILADETLKDPAAQLQALENRTQQFRNEVKTLENRRTAAQERADKAATVDKNEETRLQKRLDKLDAQREIIVQTSVFKDKIAAAEAAGNEQLAIRLKGEQKISRIEVNRKKIIAGITDQREIDKVNALALAEKTAITRDTEREINQLQRQRQEKFADIIADLDHQLALSRATTEEERKRLRIERELQKLKKQGFSIPQLNEIEVKMEELADENSPINTFIKQTREQIEKLNDPVFQAIELAKTLGNAFSESFKGIVSGSMSAQQALANLFQRTADHFLDMAAQMIAAQIRMQAVQLFMTFLSPSTPSTPASKYGSAANLAGPKGDFGLGSGPGFGNPADFLPGGRLGRRAVGGPVGAGRPYMVGERGPELFVPGAQGNIVPNNAMGGSNIVVNVDASGSSVEGDSDQAAQLGKMLGAAVQAELVKQKRPGGLLAS